MNKMLQGQKSSHSLNTACIPVVIFLLYNNFQRLTGVIEKGFEKEENVRKRLFKKGENALKNAFTIVLKEIYFSLLENENTEACS